MYKKPFSQKQQYRINERIAARELRVLDAEGKQVGVLSRDEALKAARDGEVDLVEIAPMATPPVAKLIDFNKFLYQLEKKKREEKKKAKVSETKEVRLGPFMGDHDLQVMVQRTREFLENGDKVRFVVKFKGRQVARPEFGHQVLAKMYTALSDVSKVEKDAKLEGKQLVSIIAPERKKKHEESEEEVQEHNQQTV